jgi:putative transposase
MNPVRAGMVTHPGQYPWSSYRANAHGTVDALLTPHPLFLSLGEDAISRRSAYRGLFDQPLADSDMDALRDATNYNFTFGSNEFAQTMTEKLGRQASRVSRRYIAPRPESVRVARQT